MFINDLYSAAREGTKTQEDRLFQELSVSFRLFVRQRTKNPHDVEEIVQEALMTIAAKYRSMSFEISFSAWAYRVLENKLLAFYRSRGTRARHCSGVDVSEVTAAAPEDDAVLRRQLVDCLRQLTRTRLRHARILILSFQGFGTGEICARLSVSQTNLYAMLSRARAMLSKCLNTGELK